MQENLTPMYCDEKFIAHYLMTKSKENNISPEAVAKKTKSSEDTVKNVFSGKTTNPGLLTVAPMVDAVNGSLDEMCFGKPMSENIAAPAVEFYRRQIITMQEQHERQNTETRNHYEQHRQDYKDHTEHRLADKREIIEQQKEHINTLKKENLISKIFACIGYGVLIALLILEVTNPSLGWIKF